MNQIRLFLHELESMSEYSHSLPTGTVLWKMWRKRVYSERALRKMMGVSEHPDAPQSTEDDVIEEYVGQYVPPSRPKGRRGEDLIGIRWFKVVLRQGPAPPIYRAPDWDNYAGWKRERENERAASR